MKTNQVMERKMGDFIVTQRTKEGFFNATALLKQWNANAMSERKLSNYFASEKTTEFVETIMKHEDLHTTKMVYLNNQPKFRPTQYHCDLLLF